MSDQSDTFVVGSVLIHVALHGFPGMTVEDDDPLHQMLWTALRTGEGVSFKEIWHSKSKFEILDLLHSPSLFCGKIFRTIE